MRSERIQRQLEREVRRSSNGAAVRESREGGGGFGLTSMQQSASLVGGRVDAPSPPGPGCDGALA